MPRQPESRPCSQAASGVARSPIVGIIGGMGPRATADFYRRITAATAAASDQGHLHVLIDSNPAIPDRTAFLLDGAIDPTPLILAAAARLEKAGAELIVMACNTAHAFVPALAAASGLRVVDWVGEAASAALTERPSARTVGLLATDGTVRAGLYDEAFRRLGARVISPAPGDQATVMQAIYGDDGVKAGAPDLSGARASLQPVAARLAARGADLVLLACTELSVIDAACPSPWPIATLDAAELVARRVVEMAGARLRAKSEASTG